MTGFIFFIKIALSFLPLIKSDNNNEIKVFSGNEILYFIVNVQGIEGHYCIGSYIKENWILTTASCASMVGHEKLRVKLTVGDSEDTGASGVFQYPDFYKIHPRYNAKNKSHNVGLIKLKQPFALYRKEAIIEISSPYDKQEGCVLHGWLRESLGETYTSNKFLLASKWTPRPGNFCSSKITQTTVRQMFIEDEMLCGRDSVCIVEDGAPLVCNKKLHGILSNSFCTFAILEKVSYFEHWIRATTAIISLRSSCSNMDSIFLSATYIFLYLYLTYVYNKIKHVE